MSVVARLARLSRCAPLPLGLLVAAPVAAQHVEESIFSIGSFDRPETSFGRISDVVVDLEGRIAVLDAQRRPSASSIPSAASFRWSGVAARGRAS
jgi:hypothetical protein